MADAGAFILDQYEFDRTTGLARFHYAFEGGAAYVEEIRFPVPGGAYNEQALDAALRLLFVLAGVSYYKTAAPERVICRAYEIDAGAAQWFTHVYREGLGEFAFNNKLDMYTRAVFVPGSQNAPEPVALPKTGKVLVPVGGGKDSTVTLESLKQGGVDVTLFALGNAKPIMDTIALSGLSHVNVTRKLDPRLIEANAAGAYNGHVPITAILSAITIVCAVLYGYDAVVMSNEHSASAANLVVNGHAVNHQYSKSFFFETEFDTYVKTRISPDLTYFSYLRPLSEIAIAARFSRLEKYHLVFRSCNTAFKQDETKRNKNWCCNCPKCRFVFLAMAPFMEKQKLVDIFGINMLDDAAQIDGFAELCGLKDYKPFECVGEIEESATVLAMLATLPAWQNDAVIKALVAAGLNMQDVPARFEALGGWSPDHNLPPQYEAMLDAHG